jgi:hypothetical protein
MYLKYICICNPLRDGPEGGHSGAFQTRVPGVGRGNGRRKGETHASGGTCERGKGGRDWDAWDMRAREGRERDACGRERGAGQERGRDANAGGGPGGEGSGAPVPTREKDPGGKGHHAWRAYLIAYPATWN